MTSNLYVGNVKTIDYNTTTSSSYATFDSVSSSSININNDIVIKRLGKSDIRVVETLEALMHRLAVIEPKIELIEKYPALREAYDNYKLMEALLLNDDDDETSKKV